MLSVLMVFACGGQGNDTAMDAAVSVPDGHYILEQSEGFEPIEGDTVYLSFLNGNTIGFSANCNSFEGPFEIQDGRLEVEELTRTDMGCDEDRAAQDDWLFEFFSGTPLISEAAERVTLSNSETNLVFIEHGA